MPFVIIQVVGLTILWFFPQITTFLPELLPENYGWAATSPPAGLVLAFAALFVVGGWVSIGTPPKPFAPAEGLFVGAWLQAVIMAPVLLGLSCPGQRRWR